LAPFDSLPSAPSRRAWKPVQAVVKHLHSIPSEAGPSGKYGVELLQQEAQGVSHDRVGAAALRRACVDLFLFEAVLVQGYSWYRGTSLIRKRLLPGPGRYHSIPSDLASPCPGFSDSCAYTLICVYICMHLHTCTYSANLT